MCPAFTDCVVKLIYRGPYATLLVPNFGKIDQVVLV